MKLVRKAILLLSCTLVLNGCTQSSMTDEEVFDLNPSMIQESEEVFLGRTELVEETEPISLFNWEQIDESVNDHFNDLDYYPFGIEMSYKGDEEDKTIELNWILRNEVTLDDAMEYAVELVREFNNIVATQSPIIDFAMYDTFGTLWKTFDVQVCISTESGYVMIDKKYPAGKTIDLKLPIHPAGGPGASTEEYITPSSK